MRYRLGILGGLVIMGIVALGLATGVADSGTVEAARPYVSVNSHELQMVLDPAPVGECSFVQEIVWDGSAYAHKSGHYKLFLSIGDSLVGPVEGDTVAKGTPGDTITSRVYSGTPGTEYRSRIVFFTSRGKDGAVVGSQLFLDEPDPPLVLVC